MKDSHLMVDCNQFIPVPKNALKILSLSLSITDYLSLGIQFPQQRQHL